MKLERNVKAPDRKAVVKHVQRRANEVGKSSKVRIRGHKINHEKLSRWVKENVIKPVSIPAKPPSREFSCETTPTTLIVIALPSYISIYTHSVCDTLNQQPLGSSKHKRLADGQSTASDLTSTPIQRLLRYAQDLERAIDSQKARAVFNDLQLILRNEYIVGKTPHDYIWNPRVKDDITQVRNLMNVTKALYVKGELKGR
jgi:hypothetical protein